MSNLGSNMIQHLMLDDVCEGCFDFFLVFITLSVLFGEKSPNKNKSVTVYFTGDLDR